MASSLRRNKGPFITIPFEKSRTGEKRLLQQRRGTVRGGMPGGKLHVVSDNVVTSRFLSFLIMASLF